jgi:hypothetical protein
MICINHKPTLALGLSNSGALSVSNRPVQQETNSRCIVSLDCISAT